MAKAKLLPDNAYLDALEADNDRLRLRVAELEKQVTKLSTTSEFMVMTPVAQFGLTPSEAIVFARLAASGFASNDDLLAAVSAGKAKVPDRKIIDVYICKIRNKLERFDIVIETAQGRGYKIGAAGLAKIAAIQAGTEFDSA
jgi:DNA-binding response OmpR family regulator